jgi:GPI mannosyltransferase 3
MRHFGYFMFMYRIDKVGVMMSHRRHSRAAYLPPSDANTGTTPTLEKSGRIRPWAATGSDRKVLVLALVFHATNVLPVPHKD